MFIEIDNILINLDHVSSVTFMEDWIRICFITAQDYIDIKRESEEELNRTWEWLRGICLRGQVE